MHSIIDETRQMILYGKKSLIKWYAKKKKTQIRVSENNERRFRESTHPDKFIEMSVWVIGELKTKEKIAYEWRMSMQKRILVRCAVILFESRFKRDLGKSTTSKKRFVD